MSNSLYYNGWEIIKSSNFFLYIVIGGRGIGKTYGILKGCLEDDVSFMYVRRTETELKNCCREINNPFITLNRDMNRDVKVRSIGDSFVIEEDGKQIGLGACLSTIGKFRGSDYSYIDYIVFDEFINTSSINTLRNEDDLFYNLLETIGRNREVQGKKPLKVILLANSNTLDSGIIRSLKLGEVVRLMKTKNIRTWTDEARGIYLELPQDLGITKEKQKTSLYKLTQGTKFNDMAIHNDFVNDLFDNVNKLPVNQLLPFVSVGKLFFYKIKNSEKYYVSYRKCNCKHYTEEQTKMFITQFGYFLKLLVDSGMLIYYDYDIKLEVDNLLK